MLRHLQWIAMVGVPWTFVVLLIGGGMVWASHGPRPDDGDTLAIVGVLLAATSVHAMALSSLVAAGLLVTERTLVFKTTLLNAVLGGAISTPLLAHVYFSIAV